MPFVNFDAYSFKARISPVLLVSLPGVLACLVLVPKLADWNKLWMVAASAGIIVLVDQLGRDSGRRLQDRLWAAWGGPPTTIVLRHRTTANETMLARQHEKIQNLSGIVMPNRRQERDNPAKADESYEAATSYLIAKTRNHDAYPLVFAENCNYGFRRNMLGLRTFGISISAVGFLGAAVPFLLSVFDGLEVSRFSFALVAALCLVELIMWSIVVKADWVRRAADAYAARLMEAVETLQRSQDPEPPGAAGSTISPAPNA